MTTYWERGRLESQVSELLNDDDLYDFEIKIGKWKTILITVLNI